MVYLLVTIGGFCGAISRYLLGRWINQHLGSVFPAATLIINVLGSMCLGMVYSYTISIAEGSWQLQPIYLLFGVGFCGAFTTFSTFSAETVQLLQTKKYGQASVYIISTLAGSIFGFYLASL